MGNKMTSPAGAPLPCQASPPRRILVVDDEPSVRQLITSTLARAGYHVDAAEDGALAWEALQAKHYDLLITDNAMPRISGIALVKKLRGEHLALPVVMATGVLPEEELKRHPWLDIRDILLKPFTIEQILQTVRKVFSEAGSTETASVNSQLI
jgi:DNA-binding response OmpR family regulator